MHGKVLIQLLTEAASKHKGILLFSVCSFQHKIQILCFYVISFVTDLK